MWKEWTAPTQSSRQPLALAEELEQIHGESSSVIISAERYHVAEEIARSAQSIGLEGREPNGQAGWNCSSPGSGLSQQFWA